MHNTHAFTPSPSSSSSSSSFFQQHHRTYRQRGREEKTAWEVKKRVNWCFGCCQYYSLITFEISILFSSSFFLYYLFFNWRKRKEFISFVQSVFLYLNNRLSSPIYIQERAENIFMNIDSVTTTTMLVFSSLPPLVLHQTTATLLLSSTSYIHISILLPAHARTFFYFLSLSSFFLLLSPLTR